MCRRSHQRHRLQLQITIHASLKSSGCCQRAYQPLYFTFSNPSFQASKPLRVGVYSRQWHISDRAGTALQGVRSTGMQQ
ncbi:hypothetical protein [Nostoc sp. CHAB 5715]|uniref:hypothetical protein n=1 Tax=Nostoc sp. CHAB 5715 TaxID=2780400 RepID=UPI001E585CD3|nr:hypothetical protein [Nostoc sp. CHAB 5715]MCC5622132.1 hypothetical protein [Nostoc sp. CHAB 5715]